MTFHATNPATGEALAPEFPEQGPAEVERATRLAAEAFPAFRATTPEARAAFLESIAAHIEASTDELWPRVQAETGLPLGRVQGETGRTVGQLRLFAAVVRDGAWRDVRIDPALPDRAPLPRPDLRQRAVPLGPVAVFGASNFPLAFSVAGGDTASAFAAGCPVVVKGHPAHPGTSEIVGRAISAAVAEAGLPEGVFSLLQGTTHELGTALVTDPRIKAVGFTGSRGGGLALVAAAQARPVPIPVYAEMSAVNPVFLLPGALEERACDVARGFVTSLTGSAGQLCTKPGLVFVADGAGADVFVKAAGDALADIAAGPMLTAGIAGAFDAATDRTGGTDGVTQVGAGQAPGDAAVSSTPRLFETTDAVLDENPNLHDEMFGPAALVVRVSDPARLPELAERLEGQLTATLHLGDGDDDLARDLIGELELVAGRVLVNGWPTGVDVGHTMVHGGPYPATSAPASTSVGSRAIERFLRPVAYQDVPAALLPPELRDENPYGVPRTVDGRLQPAPTQE
ncbi:aldehyde dehydrogenase (NADP(+)) [Aeromicrobium sp. Leaf350]|uniref:aldehyde dehydrogenase (NADP(+)) n=1 Tax=Aeromicrobium sp. Leaf350 TaxID=2876565 RepID=UPI001E5C5E02|nr:aldehyde dehydrogenase (NADP(+)) [Aeromicrobium sp. Leaf350]